MYNAIPSQYKKADESCSCTKCDSQCCLANKNVTRNCSCEDCSGSNTCLFSSAHKLCESRSDATNGYRSLPTVVSDVARYIASSVVQLVPQFNCSRCNATTSRNNTGTNTVELYRKLNSVPPKYTMEQLKKTYLSQQKNKARAPAITCDVDVCQTDREDFVPKRTMPSDHTTEVYRTEILKQKLAAETLKHIYVPGRAGKKRPEELNCHFDKCSKYMLEKPAGYTMDLHKNNRISQFPENELDKPAKKFTDFELFTHILDSDWNTIETPGFRYSKKSQNCECTECVENKNETNIVLFEPPGYVLDLPTATLHKKYLSHTKSCTCELSQEDNKNGSKGKCKCETHKPESECIKCMENKDSDYNTAGYIMDLSTNKPKRTCADTLKESCFPQSTFYSYQCQERRPTHKTERKKTDNAYKSPFYSKNMKIRNTQELYQVSLPPQNSYNSHKRDSCECNVSRKKRPEPCGYVLELEKYKPTKNAQELVKDVLVTQGRISTSFIVDSLPDTKKGCECSEKSKSKHESPGYVLNVPKCNDAKRCRGFGPSKTNMEMPRYPFELPKFDNTPGNTEKKKCECMKCETKSKDPSSTSELVLELPKFLQRMKKQRNDACGCPEPEKNKRTFNDNKSNVNEDCKCRGTVKSSSSGYVLDLTKYKSSARKETCGGCQEVDKNRSASHGYVFDLPKPIPKSYNQESTCGCPESKKPNKLSKECICKGTSKCKSSSGVGYILDLPTALSTAKTDGCACSKPSKQTVIECQSHKNQDVFQNSTKECGYVFDLTTIKPQRGGNNCDCRESKNKFDHQYTPTPISKSAVPRPKTCSCCKCGPQSSQYKPPAIPQKHSYECREPGNKEDLSKLVYVLPKNSNTSKTTNNCGCQESKNKLHQPICAPAPITPKMMSECSPNKKEHTSKSSDGYVLDLKTSTGNKKSCACPPSAQNRSELAGYILDLPKHKSIDHKPDKCECTTKKKFRSKANQVYRVETTMISPEKQNLCNDILRKKSDTRELFKNFNASRSTPKKHIDLCKNILKTQTEAIETLKKIYLPQQEFPKTPRNLSCDNNTKIQCPKESHLSDAEANEAAHLLSTAMLSAEVMNLPYTEFNDSLAHKKSDSDKPTRLSKYDIFQRIKEAYKACSCKVCECIPGKQVKPQTCECNECLNCLDKTDTKTSNVDKYQGQNHKDTSECTNKSLRTLHGTINQQMCDCKPCDCAECTRTMAKLCGCEPCQCIECKTRSIHQRQTLVVAPVGREENVQRLACTCSPCDCIECGLVQPLAANTMHEMSTAINRHALCRCDICLNEVCDQPDMNSCSCPRRNKVMSKPVEKSTHDFDIRTATTNQSKPVYSQRGNKSSVHDTIAMYAAVSTKYHALTSNDDISSKAEICDCDECECLNCICQEESVLNIKSSQLFSSGRTITKSDLNVRSKSILNSYEDCKFYKRQYENSHCDFTSSSYFTDDCECDPCECVKCGRDTNISCESVKSKIPHDKKHREEMIDTDKPLIRKGEILTPSTHRFRVQNQGQNSNALDVSVKEMPSNKSSKQKPTISHKLKNQSSKLSKQSSRISPSIKLGSITKANLSDVLNSPCTVNKNNSLDNEMSIYFSGYSSFETSPNASRHRKYGDNTSPISRNKHKSGESSCNSSGHDYPEYLIQFPQLTADNNLKDEMEIKSSQTRSLDRSNISQKSDSNHIIDKLSCDDVSTKENSIFNTATEMTSKKQKSKKLQQKQEYHETNNNCDKISCFRDASENVVTESSQFYKLEMKKEINYYKNKKIKYITDKDKLQDSRLFIHNRYSLKTDRKKTNYINMINNCNNIYLARKEFDSNLVQKKTASAVLPVHREAFNMCPQKCIPRPSFNNTDIINVVDFKRVRKTLREANEFSLELMRLLNMYENANKEFESISDKLKISHAFLISGDFVVKKEERDKIKKIIHSNQDQEKCYNKIENGRHSLPLSVEHNTDQQITTKPEKENSDLQTVRHDNNSSLAVAETVKLNVLEKIELKLNAEEQFSSYMPKKETIQKIGALENIQAKEGITDDVNRMQDTIVGKNKRIRKKEEINKKGNKKNIMPKRKVIISKRISVRNSNEMKGKPFTKYRITVGTSTTALSKNTSKIINEPNAKGSVNFSEKVVQQTHYEQKHCNDLKQIMKKLDSVFAGIEEIPVSTSTETSELGNNMNNNIVINHEIKEKSPWPILRKNFSWSARPYTNNNEYSNFPSMDLEVKQTVQSISQHTPANSKRRHENKALASLQVEVQKLLDMPILQSQQCNQGPKESVNTQPETIMESEYEEFPDSDHLYHWNRVDKGVGCSFRNPIDLEYEERPQSAPIYWDREDRGVNCNFANEIALQCGQSSGSLHSCCSHVRREDEEWVGCWFVKNNELKLEGTPQPLTQSDKPVREDDKEDSCPKCGQAILPVCEKKTSDDMKVHFMRLRRMSDHTVLVKWNVPRLLDQVQGYEILVDGQAVKKVFTPLETIAVITCLPNLEKLLLTIRTITKDIPETGHYPASTIIYRPRVKFQ